VLSVELVEMSGSLFCAARSRFFPGREREQRVKDDLVVAIMTVFWGRIA
jgi:hypothetical protein